MSLTNGIFVSHKGHSFNLDVEDNTPVVSVDGKPYAENKLYGELLRQHHDALKEIDALKHALREAYDDNDNDNDHMEPDKTYQAEMWVVNKQDIPPLPTEPDDEPHTEAFYLRGIIRDNVHKYMDIMGLDQHNKRQRQKAWRAFCTAFDKLNGTYINAQKKSACKDAGEYMSMTEFLQSKGWLSKGAEASEQLLDSVPSKKIAAYKNKLMKRGA